LAFAATFLVISHATAREQHDIHRFEKISNIIKQFKLSCVYVYQFCHGFVFQLGSIISLFLSQ
jgi:hypothetical protein